MVGQNNDNDRLIFVDAFRGVAILMVVIFHAYARWTEIYPYGKAFVDNPFFNLDRTGVYLFFIISGYVINISLSKSCGFKDFIWRRWLRLFPAMFIATFIILASTIVLPNRPENTAFIHNILPGLSFIAPEAWHKIGVEVESLEGSYWSLYIEASFYIIYGLAFFVFGEKKSAQFIAALAVLNVGFAYYPVNEFTREAYRISEILGIKYYFLFLTGILLRQWNNSRQFKTFLYVLIAFALSFIFVKNKVQLILAFIPFVLCFRFAGIAKFFANPVFLFMGAISYPLYLVHEGIMIGFMTDLAKVFEIPAILLPILPIGFVILIATFIAKHEEMMRQAIKKTILYIPNIFKSRLKSQEN